MNSSAKSPDRCGGCGRKLPPDASREWLCRGTGACYNCARARVAKAEAEPAGRLYLRKFYQALDSYRPIAVGLRVR